MSKFDYLNQKISDAKICSEPFPHLYIENFFQNEHFDQLVNAPEIHLKAQSDDVGLFNILESVGYKTVPFPGATTDIKEYIRSRRRNTSVSDTRDTCEASGVVLRLQDPKSNIVKEIKDHIESKSFFQCLSKKFNVSVDECSTDVGIQKYLDGYEISPHLDIRKKALTFMVNSNSDSESESKAIHTHYMKFKPEYEYICKFRELNETAERNWVPWEWCETQTMQTANNSIVVFSPFFQSLHAVKAQYNHLAFQRTQLYGNLWYEANFQAPTWSPGWGDLMVGKLGINAQVPLLERISILATKLSRLLKPSGKSIDSSRRKNY